MRGELIAATLSSLEVVLLAFVVSLALVLAYKFLTRTKDMRVGKTRYGFFIERDPFEDELPFEPGVPPDETTRQLWPKEDQ